MYWSQIFLGVLIDHVVYLASADQSFSLINLIVPHVFSLSNSYPLSAAQHFVAKLDIMQKNFVRGLSKSPLSLEAKTWPGAPELAVLRLIGLVWSTSDFSHPVVAPALLLICQYLGQSRIRSAADLASGLMLCGLCLQVGPCHTCRFVKADESQSLKLSRSASYRKSTTFSSMLC